MSPRSILPFLIAAVLFDGCGGAPTSVRSGPTPHVAVSAPDAQSLFPTTWAPSADDTDDPSVRLRLVSAQRSGVMLLREIFAGDSVASALRRSETCLPAQITLRSRLATDGARVRVTRTPEPMTTVPDACSYVVDEAGTLIRVVVFPAYGSIFELEARSLLPGVPMSDIARDQMTFLERLSAAGADRFVSVISGRPSP